VSPARVLILSSSGELPGSPVEAKNKQENSGSDTTPSQGPEVEEWVVDDSVSEHGPDVVDEPLGAVDPADTDALAETEDEKSKVSSVLVHEDHPVATGLGDTAHTEDEPEQTVEEHDEVLPLSEGGELVQDGRGDGLDDAELAVHSQSDEHEEEEDGPERRDGKESDSLGVGDEGKTKLFINDLVDRLVQNKSHVSQDGEDHEPSKDGSGAVCDGYDHGVTKAVVLELVV